MLNDTNFVFNNVLELRLINALQVFLIVNVNYCYQMQLDFNTYKILNSIINRNVKNN